MSARSRQVMRLALLLSAVLLNACAGIVSRAECRGGDWQAIGAAQAMSGRALDVAAIRGACAEHDTAIDEGLLRAGYVAGTRRYCQPKRIRQQAFENRPQNTAICPADLIDSAEAAVFEGQGAREAWAETWAFRKRIGLLDAEQASWSASERVLGEYVAGRLAHRCRSRHRQVTSMMNWSAAETPDWRGACGLRGADFSAVEQRNKRLERARDEHLAELAEARRAAIDEVRRSNTALAQLYAFSREQGQDRDTVDASITARSLRQACDVARADAVALGEPLIAYGGVVADPPPACD